MKKLVVLFIVLLSVVVNAKTWTVSSNTGLTGVDFYSVQEAHDAAAAGDTLYVLGSSIPHSELTMQKKLTVMGVGYFLGADPNFFRDNNTSKINSIIIEASAAGTAIIALEIDKIEIRANNILFMKNICKGSGRNDIHIKLSNNCSNIYITKNFISANSYQGTAIYSSSAGSNVVIANNLIQNNGQYGIAIWNSASPFDIVNNIIYGHLYLYSCGRFYNNVILKSLELHISEDAQIFNNLCYSDQLEAINGNVSNVDMNTVFIDPNSKNDRGYQLLSGSPATGAGLNGEDCGMFGGASPYVLSGLPNIPYIYYLDAPYSATSASNYPVHLKIKAGN